MPIIKSAIKKLRKDKKRTVRNKALKRRYKDLVKKALGEPTEENIKKAVSVIDRAAKRNIIHKNKASRLKSRVMKPRKKKVEKGKGKIEVRGETLETRRKGKKKVEKRNGKKGKEINRNKSR